MDVYRIDEILAKNGDEPIKDFSSTELSLRDLEHLKKKLAVNQRRVHFIYWHKDQQIPVDLKSAIQKNLIENILSDERNHLVIDLTRCHLDADFVKRLVDAIEKNRSNRIGAVILNESDEACFRNDTNYKHLVDILRHNNETCRRFPSEYVYALITCHCNNDTNKKTLEKLTNLGWKVVKKFYQTSQKSSDNHMSILYKNESSGQLVLAFRGLKLEPKDLFVEESKLKAAVYGSMSNEITA